MVTGVLSRKAAKGSDLIAIYFTHAQLASPYRCMYWLQLHLNSARSYLAGSSPCSALHLLLLLSSAQLHVPPLTHRCSAFPQTERACLVTEVLARELTLQFITINTIPAGPVTGPAALKQSLRQPLVVHYRSSTNVCQHIPSE